MSDNLVMSEDEALELLSFLVMSARTMVDEPNEYAPLRLLTAARRLAESIAGRASAGTQALIHGPLQQFPQTATRMADPDGYTAQLDGLCSEVAAHLVRHFGLDRGNA